ncbi:hypothetical protein FVEN_g12802 [Fusarium venenatum]|nr:hypothetical protein FVEN_g12802 [Fusarium venenatum]
MESPPKPPESSSASELIISPPRAQSAFPKRKTGSKLHYTERPPSLDSQS